MGAYSVLMGAYSFPPDRPVAVHIAPHLVDAISVMAEEYIVWLRRCDVDDIGVHGATYDFDEDGEIVTLDEAVIIPWSAVVAVATDASVVY